MTDKKLVIEKEDSTEKTYHIFNAYSETHLKLKQIKEETGLPMAKLLKLFVDFGIENLEIKEAQHG
ncbi:hypothetical protein ACEN4A_01465 [Latilactobacillus sakei]|uniref:hypothetical protein n=1 Tax=Latilactobacillus sakei TaxID=1599 RepID=UPI003888DA34